MWFDILHSLEYLLEVYRENDSEKFVLIEIGFD